VQKSKGQGHCDDCGSVATLVISMTEALYGKEFWKWENPRREKLMKEFTPALHGESYWHFAYCRYLGFKEVNI
jgi:hypothetical protein